MEREHTVSMSVTNGAECICNPEILLGTNYGLWNFEKEVAPRGTLLDLNAAWELFLSKQGFDNDVTFKEVYHYKHEVIDGVTYEDGDTEYTLMDGENETNAKFVIKANKGPVEHIEWLDGNLILYYTKTRPVTQDDIDSGVPLHYVYDEHGNPIIDDETGKPLIYDYVKIPVIEIFDNDETHKLFPWFADDLHTVRTRQNVDNNTNEHLGDFAVTSDSEVFFAKERYAENVGNTLISLLSVYDLLKRDLGITHTYLTDSSIIDKEGDSIHQRANGNNLNNVLETPNKESIVSAINSIKGISDRLHSLIDGHADWDSHTNLGLHEYFLNHTANLVEALNYIQGSEIGDFINEIDNTIYSQNDVKNIVTALNNIFTEAENNKNRIGYNNTTKQWIVLNTKSNSNLTEAINEVDLHVDALKDEIGVVEKWDLTNQKTYYSNPNLNNITKNRLRIGTPVKDDTTIIEDINELQSLIGNLDSSKSSVTTQADLNTDNKNTIVEAINEVDTHADNNYSAIGAAYSLNTSGQKNSVIQNLTTKDKNTIVDAINELDAELGNLDGLSTDDKLTIVDSINEVISEAPFIYQDTENPNSGVVLKNLNNTSGEKSFTFGNLNNNTSKNSFVQGTSNEVLGNYSTVEGEQNTSRGEHAVVFGKTNTNDGAYNLVSGESNNVKGSKNLVHGTSNTLKSSTNSVAIGLNNEINCDNATAIGKEITIKVNSDNVVALGRDLTVDGSNSAIIGNRSSVEANDVSIGNNNSITGELNYSLGQETTTDGAYNYNIGKSNQITGDNNYSFGKELSSTGNANTLIGNNSEVIGDSNIVIGNLRVESNNTIVLGSNIQQIHENSTHIAKEIYIQTHNTESNLLKLIFVDLNDWCKLNNAASLNGEKFLDSTHLVEALKVYLTRNYTDNALLRFKMLNENENGFIMVQGKSRRIFVNGSWYFTDNIENGWSRHDGEYLKVIKKTITDSRGHTINKYYLAFMDLLSTEALVDTVGALRSNTEDYGSIDLTHAYGAVDFDDINTALDLDNRFKAKVDKSAKIITKYRQSDGNVIEKYLNFIDPNNSNLSADITLDLKESFGFDMDSYQKLSEKGYPNGYVPLNNNGVIDSRYLPSYVDDVVDVWAEYEIDSVTGALLDIHLYEIVNQTIEGQEYATKGREILQGELGKIYVEANPSDRRFSTLFRWTGTQFIPIGFTNIVIGRIPGTAFDGGAGQELLDNFTDHINSGTTQVSVETPEGTKWVTYKPNPHNVKAEQLDVVINDPNDPENVDMEDEFTRGYNVLTALQQLFDRLNTVEDKSDSLAAIIGTAADIKELDDLDEVEGNDSPTIIRTLLNNKSKIDSLAPISEDADHPSTSLGGETTDGSVNVEDLSNYFLLNPPTIYNFKVIEAYWNTLDLNDRNISPGDSGIIYDNLDISINNTDCILVSLVINDIKSSGHLNVGELIKGEHMLYRIHGLAGRPGHYVSENIALIEIM